MKKFIVIILISFCIYTSCDSNYKVRGIKELNNCNFQKAIELLSKAKESDSTNFEISFNLGHAHYLINDYKTAITYYLRAQKLDPDTNFNALLYETYFLAGEKYMVSYEEYAIDCFTKVLNYDPKDTASLINRAISYSSSKNYDNSIKDCNKALLLDSTDGNIYYIRGVAFIELGDTLKGCHDLKIAKRLKSELAGVEYKKCCSDN